MLKKNENLLVFFSEIQLRSVKGSAFPYFSKIYCTPSRISFSNQSRITANGVIYDKSLKLEYPGLSQNQFNELASLLNGLYQAVGITGTGETYQLTTIEDPFQVSTNYRDSNTTLNFECEAITAPKTFEIPTEEEQDEEIGFPYTLTFSLP